MAKRTTNTLLILQTISMVIIATTLTVKTPPRRKKAQRENRRDTPKNQKGKVLFMIPIKKNPPQNKEKKGGTMLRSVRKKTCSKQMPQVRRIPVPKSLQEEKRRIKTTSHPDNRLLQKAEQKAKSQARKREYNYSTEPTDNARMFPKHRKNRTPIKRLPVNW